MSHRISSFCTLRASCLSGVINAAFLSSSTALRIISAMITASCCTLAASINSTFPAKLALNASRLNVSGNLCHICEVAVGRTISLAICRRNFAAWFSTPFRLGSKATSARSISAYSRKFFRLFCGCASDISVQLSSSI